MFSHGLLGLPFPLYGAVNGVLSGLLGAAGAILVWSLFCSGAVLFLYRLCSPQEQLRFFKRRMREIQVELAKNPDDLRALLRLSGENIRLALKRFAFTFLPTCIAVLPLFSLTCWINAEYGYAAPLPDERIGIAVQPEGAAFLVGTLPPGRAPAATNAVRMVAGMSGVVLLDSLGNPLQTVGFPPPGNAVAHRQWWNGLLGNPMGYLPASSEIDSVQFAFGRRDFIPVGPNWLRGWETLFLMGMTVFSLLLKIVFKVE
ncbi:hypothetical protein [Pontiella sp.]|uniref:hypothetical protein n=1 Tax=Pontiella sp. TaxID=2837462 RepID=UPI003565C4C5